MFELEKIQQKTQEQGADHSEIYYIKNRTKEVELEKDQIKYSKVNENEGIGIRVIKENKLGFASTSIEEKINDTIKSAIAHTDINNLKLNSFANKKDYPNVKGLFDQKISSYSPKSLLDDAKELINSAKKEEVYPTSGSVETTTTKIKIINSSGIKAKQKLTTVSGKIETIAKSEKDTATAYDFDTKRSIDKINFSEIGEKAAKITKNSLNSKKPPTGENNIILKPMAISALLRSTLIPSLSAEQIQKGRSKADELLNEKIGPNSLNITDDGTKKYALGSKKFDAEGTPTSKRKIVKEGTLKNVFHNLKTSDRAGIESTGNAHRKSITKTPSISPTNFIIQPRKPKDEIIEDGNIIIRSILGAHTANTITGDFSVGIKNGFKIEDGEKIPISQSMFSGNIYELIKNIQEIGDDQRQIGSIITPSIKTKARISS